MAASWLAEVWQEYSKELFDVVLQQLAEGHVDFFTDLSTSEKALFVDRAAKAVNGGSIYRALVSRINSALEEQFGKRLSYKMHESKSMRTRTEAFGSRIQDGVVSLLQKWPDMKSKLHILFNHSLPPDLRKLTWNLYLSNTKVRMEYLSWLSLNLAQSNTDKAIFLKCESLLSSEPTFKTLSETKYAAKIMSNVLSYYQRIQHSSDYLSEANYLLLVPLVQVSLAATTLSALLNVPSTQLVEEYVTFMEWWKRELVNQMPGSSADDNLFEGMANMLDEKDKEVSAIIQKIYTQQAGNQSRQDLLRGLQSLLNPVISTLFVGYLNMETLLYVWDQHIIGLGHPSYNCLPAFCLAFILLLREHLQICKTPGDVDAVLRSHAAELTSLQFQKVIKEHFYSNLYKSLTKQNTDVFMALDSDQEKVLPAWTHLFRNHLPYRSQPKERQQAREQRDAQHMQCLKEAKLTKLREDEEQSTKEKKLQSLLEESQRINQEQKISFEEKLRQERHLQYEMQRKAEEQVNQLQVEMRHVMQQRQFSTDAYSLTSFIPPPPASLESTRSSGIRKPGQSVPPEDLKITTPILTMNQHQPTGKGGHVTLDILHYLMHTTNSIANGFGEQTLLNKTTQEQLQTYQQDVRNAEFQLFGHHVDSDELDTIHEPKRSELSRKLTDAVQRGVETRYRAHLSQQEMFSNTHML
ncbi:uncharacterized protein LOC116988735 isoform X2 [Amblyraja radiata]|uniref:uncharacterized protein LOC116988735 isoform X2 n=1 Tax=Amblyraja radiata TaxID=386614 RepID=UPI0014035677|nr:uncharacterized protein LOC116988735 isoform X2 [Amblyraja radiata]